VVDDHALFRLGLCEILAEEGFDVAEAESGEAALRRVKSLSPDVVVMDVSMPGISGIEATRRLRACAPAAGVLMLSIADDDVQVLDALRAGASGYLLKEADLAEIIAGIRCVAAGHCPLSPRVARALVDSVRRNAQTSPVVVGAGLNALSIREREVLSLIAEGRDNAEIGRQLFVSPSTVKNHVSRLLERLGVDNRVQAATYAIRHGLVSDQDAYADSQRAAA
jgi:DNA-binding NarL/FixJ family response regulator